MARTSLTATTLVKNGSAALTETIIAGGATGTDGFQVATGDIADSKIIINIRKDAGATGPIWIKAGSFDASGQGDIEVSIAGGLTLAVGPLEGARLKSVASSTGYIYLDAGVTGIVSIAKLP